MTAHIGKSSSKAISNFQIAVNRILLTPIPWRCVMSMGRVKTAKHAANPPDEQVDRTLLASCASLQYTALDKQIHPRIALLLKSVDALEGLLKTTIRTRYCSSTDSITPTSPNPQLQFTASFAPAATPCELHPTSAHPPHSTSHHRECCPPVRLTLCIPERMVHA